MEGSRLLANAKVATKVQEAMDARAIACGISSEMVLAELYKLASYNVQDFIHEGTDGLRTISALDRNAAAAITEITSRTIGSGDDVVLETKVKLADKGANLERLGKHLKLFTDVVQNNTTVTIKTREELEAQLKAKGIDPSTLHSTLTP